MKKCLLTIIMCISISSLSAQETDRFENKLSDFRYSLYQDIANVAPDSLPSVTDLYQFIYNNPAISEKLKNFMNDNKQEIVAYKTNILKQHESEIKIDTTLYDIEPSILDDFMLFDNDISSYDLSTIEFILLNPIAVGNLFKTSMNGRKSTQSLAIDALASSITSPKIFARHIDDDLWEVVYDYHWYVMVMEIDLSKGILSTEVKTVYRLKGLPDII